MLRQSFNEAAARCRGKRNHINRFRIHFNIASMRPRPDAVENMSDVEVQRAMVTELQ